jgi:hypothetical protein
MYWALSGGGGGTYGVVSSLTAKVYPNLKSSTATLSFASNGAHDDAFWNGGHAYYDSLLSLTEGGCFTVWGVSSTGFSLEPANCPGLSKQETKKLFQPMLAVLEKNNVKYSECSLSTLQLFSSDR